MTTKAYIMASITLLAGLNLYSSQGQAKIVESKFENELFLDLENPHPEETKSVTMTSETATEIPDGTNKSDLPPSCDPRRIEELALSKKTTVEYFTVMKDFFNRCDSDLKSNSSIGQDVLADQAKVGYDFNDSPLIQEIKVPLKNGRVVPGLLALRVNTTPRPLVILKCGVFCSASNSPANRSYLMHLFDQSPFNVLILANQTGSDYIAANHVMSMGGWQEGQETIEVGQWMTSQWSLRKRISSLHLMGMSLGGNAAIFGAAYNDNYKVKYGKNLFSSVTAICPVISLDTTLDHLYNYPAIGLVFAYKTRQHLLNMRQHLNDIPDMISPWKIPAPHLMPDYLGWLAATSLERRGITPMHRELYYYNNDFWSLKTIPQTPTLVWASKNDNIVNYDINAGRAEEYFKDSKNAGVLGLTSGGHCGFSSAYGNQASAAVLRSFVLKNSPEFLSSRYTTQSTKLVVPLKLGSREVHVNQGWEFVAGSDRLNISYKTFDGTSSTCAAAGPWKSKDDCKTVRKFSYPISDFKALGARVPRTQTEAYILSREFNTKVEFRTSSAPLNGTNSPDVYVSWKNGY